MGGGGQEGEGVRMSLLRVLLKVFPFFGFVLFFVFFPPFFILFARLWFPERVRGGVYCVRLLFGRA